MQTLGLDRFDEDTDRDELQGWQNLESRPIDRRDTAGISIENTMFSIISHSLQSSAKLVVFGLITSDQFKHILRPTC